MKIIIFIIYSFIFITINWVSCQSNMRIDNTDCFTDEKIFKSEDKYYRVGHFASNKKGDMLI